MLPNPLALRAMETLQRGLQSIAELNEKTFFVLSQAEIEARIQVVPLPAVGIVYEGMTPTGQAGFDTGTTPMQVKLSFATLLFYKSNVAVGRNQSDLYKPEALTLLDTMRTTLRLTPGPFGPFWQFAGEMPADELRGVVVWAQRWTLPSMFPAPS
jgi:hypothetical protein